MVGSVASVSSSARSGCSPQSERVSLPIGVVDSANSEWLRGRPVKFHATKMSLRVASSRRKKGGRSAEVVFCVVPAVHSVVEPVFQGLVEDLQQWQRARGAAAARVSVHVRRDFNGVCGLRQ